VGKNNSRHLEVQLLRKEISRETIEESINIPFEKAVFICNSLSSFSGKCILGQEKESS
jgi:hypothetical protein